MRSPIEEKLAAGSALQPVLDKRVLPLGNWRSIYEFETDKATFTVEAPVEGYLPGVNGETGEMLEVGSVIAWIGSTANEAIESASPGGQVAGTARNESNRESLHPSTGQCAAILPWDAAPFALNGCTDPVEFAPLPLRFDVDSPGSAADWHPAVGLMVAPASPGIQTALHREPEARLDGFEGRRIRS